MKFLPAMRRTILFTMLTCCLVATSGAADDVDHPRIKETVDHAVRAVMQAYAIPGMAIGLTIGGKRQFYNYGVASWKNGHAITSKTLFEIGSISKTLTATLACYAERSGRLSFSDSPGKYLASLKESHFAGLSLLDLGTHTHGGLPLQVPDDVSNTSQLIDYLTAWRPAYPAGTRRTYSNVGIGMLGMIAARSMDQSFEDALEKTVFTALGMANSYINVPNSQMEHYAQGYTRKDAPIRMKPGVLAAEAYAVKSTAADMIRFLEANMEVGKIDETLQRAITDTHIGHFRAENMIQGLIWEQYPYPAELEQLLNGNSDAMIYEAAAVTKLIPPLPRHPDVLLNKTGSTNGFSAYVAFVPGRKTGVVLLANKNFPIGARVTAVHRILHALDSRAGNHPAQ